MTYPTSVIAKFELAQTPILMQIAFDNCGNGWIAERHCNAQYEFHIMLSGSSMFNVDGNVFSLKAGETVIVAPGQYHYGYQTSEDFTRFTISFHIESGFLETQLQQACKNEIIIATQRKTLQLCRDILEELHDQHPFQIDALRNMCIQLMIQLFRSLQLETLDVTSDSGALDSQRISIIDSFFGMDALEMGTEEELARRLGISRRQLNRVLVKHYGMGFRKKMLQTRMEYAGWLLKTTDYKVSKVATMVGYATDTSFYKAFQNHYGVTPQYYRGEFK